MTVLLSLVLTVAPWQSLDAGARAEQLATLERLPVDARFLAATEGFLGTSYVLSPLGEGAGHDADPLLRYDAADCVTMVEESMALALSRDDARVLEVLNHIRYEGAPSYEGRLHVMEAQWLPVNLRRGLLEDVTRTYGKDATRRVSKRITEATWAEKGGASLGLPASAQVKGEFELDIVPSERAPAALAVAPSGLIVVVVRADRPRLVSRITHVGVLVQKPEGTFLRHASRSFKKVVDEPIERYLKRNLEFGAWTVEGVALYRVLEPAWLAPVVVDAGVAAQVDAGPASQVDAGPPPEPATQPVPVVAAPSRACGCSSAALLGPLAVVLLVLSRARARR